MKNVIIIVFCTILVFIFKEFGFGQILDNNTRSLRANVFYLDNINIVDIENGTIIPNKTLLIRENIILSIVDSESSDKLPDIKVVDCTDKYIIPGLWDMHTHASGNKLMYSVYLPLYIAHGVTGVREMSGKNQELKIRDSIARGELVGPRMLVGSSVLNGLSTWNPAPTILVDNTIDASNIVDSLKTQGFDFIKTYTFLSREVYLAIIERANEIGIEVSGHIPASVNIKEATKLGHKTIEHLIGIELGAVDDEKEIRNYLNQKIISINEDTPANESKEIWRLTEWYPTPKVDSTKLIDLFDFLSNQEVWVVPTLNLQKLISYPNDLNINDKKGLQYLPPIYRNPILAKVYYDQKGQLKETVDYRLNTLKTLNMKGVSILAGTDMLGGFPLHGELELYVDYGLTPAEALKTATLNPAIYLNRTDSLGSVTEGKLADLVILDANPLDDIKNIRKINSVILNGCLHDRKELDQMLLKAKKTVDTL